MRTLLRNKEKEMERLKIIYRFCLTLALVIGYGGYFPQRVSAQPFLAAKNYFMFPINPGQPNSLSGNMGELRTNHFHAGIDIRTGLDFLPVFAAADGYVMKVKITTNGYGKTIFIKHPNGLVTVYAHLYTFSKALADYVRQKQYEKESFEIDLNIPKDLFPVKKGDYIARSGNTGSSGGPHLHFEVRDSTDGLINPLLLGFKEIDDHLPPVIGKLAFRTLQLNSRVNGEFGRVVVVPKKDDPKLAVYSLANPVLVQGTVGLELVAYDRITNGSNFAGINTIALQLDGKEIYYFNADYFSFSDANAINMYLDYETYKLTGNRFQRCYIADGNRLSFYRSLKQNGKITITDTLTHTVRLSVWDAQRNLSQLNFTIKGQKTQPKQAFIAPETNAKPPKLLYKVYENTLKLTALNLTDSMPMASLFVHKTAYRLPLAYRKKNSAIYLWDLRKGLPDSLYIGDLKHGFHFKQIVPPRQPSKFMTDIMAIHFNENALSDTLYLEVKEGLEKNVYCINDVCVPLFNYMSLGLKTPTLGLNKSKTALYIDKRFPKFIGGTWNNDIISAYSKDLGNFRLLTDATPPTIQLASANPNTVKFRIWDNLSGIKSYRATLNGQWLLMNYDFKSRSIWSERLDNTKPLTGLLTLRVTDNMGNEQVFERKMEELIRKAKHKHGKKFGSKKFKTKNKWKRAGKFTKAQIHKHKKFRTHKRWQ